MSYDNKLNLKRDKTIKTIEKNEPKRETLTANNIKINKQREDVREKIQTEKKRMEEIETKLKFEMAMNDATIQLITDLQVKLESKRKENDKLRKQLNETIRKTKSLDEGHKTKGDVVIQAKSNKDFSKINSEAGNNDLDTKNQEIIFKVQIISSDTLLAINSPKLKGLKNVWEYKDGGLYKYTVGNEKDLKSASLLQSEFRRKSFSGAFVVAFKNGKRIPVREAQRLLN
jgi:chromosome segregation ATPase